jgi:hypothetical protein
VKSIQMQCFSRYAQYKQVNLDTPTVTWARGKIQDTVSNFTMGTTLSLNILEKWLLYGILTIFSLHIAIVGHWRRLAGCIQAHEERRGSIGSFLSLLCQWRQG